METETYRIIQAVLEDIESNRTITLDAAERYGGSLGDYKVQFEGEDDLLHCSIRRIDGGPIEIDKAHQIAEPFFGCCPKGLVWFQPAKHSVHYFIGHDDFLRAHRESQP